MITDRLKTFLPHYLAMFVLALGVLWVLSSVFGRLGFWVQLVVILVVLLGYRAVALALGFAPELWQR